jgi:hypothetical protein
MLGFVPATAQQTTGTAGSPSATTTIDGRYLPSPPQPFGGDIGLNAMQSKPAWPARVVPPKDAPNILLIMTDDVGFGAPATFGGAIPTPTLDRIAANGLRYINFHSTRCVRQPAPLSSPGAITTVWVWSCRRDGDRIFRLQQHHSQGQRHDRPHSPRLWVRLKLLAFPAPLCLSRAIDAIARAQSCCGIANVRPRGCLTV